MKIKNQDIAPVLFCIYNRLEYTKKTFIAKPKKLFIAADGPVYKNKKDKINCLKTREWVLVFKI